MTTIAAEAAAAAAAPRQKRKAFVQQIEHHAAAVYVWYTDNRLKFYACCTAYRSLLPAAAAGPC